MKIVSNPEFKCYETSKTNWASDVKDTITLDGELLIPISKSLPALPADATNGDAIKAIFPGGTETYVGTKVHYIHPNGYSSEFDAHWWQAPYAKEAPTES